MNNSEFDRYADQYDEMHRSSVSFFGKDIDYFTSYKVAHAARIAPESKRVLDFGGGIGKTIPYFRKHLPGAELTLADVSQKSLETAAQRYPGAERLVHITGNSIGASPDYFDLIFTSCVFHHIPEREHVMWLRELCKKTKPGGKLVLFEHNPKNPLTRKAVRDCEFDVGVTLINHNSMSRRISAAGWNVLGVTHHVFFPQLLSALRVLDPMLRWLPVGGQYSVFANKPA